MGEHLTDKQFEDYCRQQLQVGDLIAVSEHLAKCEPCRVRVDNALNADGAFLAVRAEIFEGQDSPLETSSHLELNQIEHLVDQDPLLLADQTVNDHLSSCEPCSLAVADLRAFRNEIATSLDRDFAPAISDLKKEGWWTHKNASLKSLLGFSPVPAFGLALSVCLLAVVGWIVVRKVQEQNPGQELAIAPPVASPTTPDVASIPSPEPSEIPVSPSNGPASLVAQLNDGNGVIGLDSNGNLSGADNLPSNYRSLMKKTLSTGRLEKSSQLNGLARPQSALMGSNDQGSGFAVIGPAGNVLLNDKPTFRWNSLPGAVSYVVEVYDSNFKPVMSSPKLTTSTWTPPQSLTRGKIYSWQVKATKDGEEVTSPKPPAPQAKFRVLDKSKVDELERARRNYSSSHLTLGLLYVDAGLMKEAESEFRALVKANPKSDTARNLLRQVK